jgi:hypothetical protein
MSSEERLRRLGLDHLPPEEQLAALIKGHAELSKKSAVAKAAREKRIAERKQQVEFIAADTKTEQIKPRFGWKIVMRSLKFVALSAAATWKLLISSPLAFALGASFLMLYALVSWSLLHRIDWHAIGWEDHHLLFDGFPRAPSFHIPFLGAPTDWSIQGSMWSFFLMTGIWIGSVFSFAKMRR